MQILDLQQAPSINYVTREEREGLENLRKKGTAGCGEINSSEVNDFPWGGSPLQEKITLVVITDGT